MPFFLFLANSEKWKGKGEPFLCAFVGVPFFYYLIHLYVIHITAMIFVRLSGFGWGKMILPTWITLDPQVRGYGYSLGTVYLVWGALILFYTRFAGNLTSISKAIKRIDG